MIKKSQISKLPTTPGIYLFKDKAGAVLYVGKAACLKERVRSYFKKNLSYERPIEFVIEKIQKIETKKTDTVLEAFILEQSLIKKHQPPYNVIGKDDKSFCYVAVTKEDFPRFEIIRQTDLNPKNYPATLDLAKSDQLKTIYPVVKPEVYTIGAHYSLPTKNKSLPATHYLLLTSYGPFTSKKSLLIALRILQKIFPYHRSRKKTEKGCLDFQLGLCPGPYAGKISKKEYRKNIRAIEMVLQGKKKSLIKKIEKEMKAASKKQQYEIATEKRNQLFALKHIRDTALIESKLKFKTYLPTRQVKNLKLRLESYDISNISGRFSVGSMVVFSGNSDDLEPDKSQYRKFRIKNTAGIDDVGAMKEVLQRRFNHSWPQPDLIILDGGKGHLNMALKLFKELKINIPLLAVAKGPKRKKLDLYPYGPVPKLSLKDIALLRDEAHRFAITYHRKLREKIK